MDICLGTLSEKFNENANTKVEGCTGRTVSFPGHVHGLIQKEIKNDLRPYLSPA